MRILMRKDYIHQAHKMKGVRDEGQSNNQF